MPDGRAVLVDVSANSATAFAEFFEAQRTPALRFAYVMCGSSGEAEDVVSSAFTRMYPAWTRGHIEEPVAYLRRTITNEVRGGWRRKEVRQRHDARLRVVGSDHAPDAATAVTARDAVSVVLASLPPKQRAVVALRYLEDLSEAETAEVLGISVGTVKSHASRGLERLREVLEAQQGEEQ